MHVRARCSRRSKLRLLAPSSNYRLATCSVLSQSLFNQMYWQWRNTGVTEKPTPPSLQAIDNSLLPSPGRLSYSPQSHFFVSLQSHRNSLCSPPLSCCIIVHLTYYDIRIRRNISNGCWACHNIDLYLNFWKFIYFFKKYQNPKCSALPIESFNSSMR